MARLEFRDELQAVQSHPTRSSTMSRKQEFDPNAIPNYGGAGRVGELDPNDSEEQQSSAQIAGTNPEIQTDPAAGEGKPDTGTNDPGTARADAANAQDEAARAEVMQPGRPIPPQERPRTMRDDRARGKTHLRTDNPEPMPGGAGGIDGLVGAP
jgi:hypothetical protein